MYKRIISLSDLTSMTTGDVIFRNTNTTATNSLSEIPLHSDVFELRSINMQAVLELVEPARYVALYASAGDIHRLFIKSEEVINEETWWCDSK